MKRPRANPSRIPPRSDPPPAAAATEGEPRRYRIRTGRETARRWQQSLSKLPRWGRMLLVGILALAVTLLIFPQVDEIYLTYFYNPSTVVIPSYVSAGVGMLMYMAGWFLIVGSRTNKPQEQVSSSPALLWYIGLGALALVLCTVLLLHGLTLTDVAAG